MPKVLVVEDSRVTQQLFVKALVGRVSCLKADDIDTCMSADEARQSLQENEYDIILLDEHLRGEGRGSDILHWMHQNLDRNIPVISISGASSKGVLKWIWKAFGYISTSMSDSDMLVQMDMEEVRATLKQYDVIGHYNVSQSWPLTELVMQTLECHGPLKE